MNLPTPYLDSPAARRYYWTTAEDAALREAYARGGSGAARKLLPGRTDAAIHARAQRLGVKAPREVLRGKKPAKWFASDAIDAQIRAVYGQAPQRNAVVQLATAVMRPRWWVSKRAAQLGLVAPRCKAPDWTETELDMLRGYAHLDVTALAQRMRRAGHRRTATAIAVRRKRIGIDFALARADAGLYSATQLARLMGVSSKTVSRWIAEEGLPAKPRGTARVQEQGGDHWEIAEKPLRAWIGAHAQLIDLRKVDRYWFIELAFGRYA